MVLFIVFVIVIVAVILIIDSAVQKNKFQSRHNFKHNNQSYRGNLYRSNSSSLHYKKKNLSDKPDKFWKSKNQTIEIKGYSLSKGFVYIGSNLSSVRKDYYGGEVEPALVDPQKSVDRIQPDLQGESLSYWPSYQTLTPQARAAYLKWLESGRDDKEVPIGYVFLYYYGLERRILNDSQFSDIAKSELSELIDEVKRLISVYGGNQSFNNFATNLIEFVELSQNPKQKFKESVSNECLDYESYSLKQFRYSLNFKMGLAYFALNEIPLPAEWALKWVVINRHSFRTPARRCRDKFQVLFKKRYKERYGNGLKLKPNKTYIKASYRSASRSLGYENFNANTNIPDLTVLKSPLKNIKNLFEECTDLLDPYSRHLGRNPEDVNSTEALSKLPGDLISEINDSKVKDFTNKLDRALGSKEYTLVNTTLFIDYWEIEGVNKFRKKEAIEVAQLIQRLGYGLEPDIRFGYHKIDKEGQIAIFKLHELNSRKKPTEEYKSVLPIVHMTALVGLADGNFKPEEEMRFEEYLESLNHFNSEEKKRLNAYLLWLKNSDVTISRLKQKIDKLSKEEKVKVLDYLISVAWADEHIHPDEVSILQKLADMFKIDESVVLKKLYNLEHGDTDELVGVSKSKSDEGYTLPERKREKEFLDEELVKERIKQTSKVQNILSNVFEDDSSEKLEMDDSRSDSREKQSEELYLGLDKLHSDLVKKLIEKDSWTKAEYNKFCEELGLMPSGAMELINERAYEVHDDELILLYEDIEINDYIVDNL